MSGKFRICSVINVIALFIYSSAVYGSEAKKETTKKEAAAKEPAPKKEAAKPKKETKPPPKYVPPKVPPPKPEVRKKPPPPPDPRKTNLIINGYKIGLYDTSTLLGLREKAVADLYFTKGAYAQAIKHYENASKYITNEADIYYNLGNIYAYERVYNIAAVYYKKASEKYVLPENLGKTQKNYYLSLIRYGFSLEKLNNEEDHKKAQAVLVSLLDKKDEITNHFPEIMDEFNKYYLLINGNTTVQDSPK